MSADPEDTPPTDNDKSGDSDSEALTASAESPEKTKTNANPSATTLPIEGESKWVMVMRLLAFGTLTGLLVIAAVFHFLSGDNSFVESQQIGMMLGGLVFLLILEYFVFLFVVIPRQADYGRYEIHRDRVDYYPLTALGLGISSSPRPERLSRFMGITTGRMQGSKKAGTQYAVYLVHGQEKGKNIVIRTFSDPMDAEKFATVLAARLQINVASGLRNQAKKRAL